LSDPSGRGPKAAILGVAGTELSDRERRLLAKAPPVGFILFQRNCREPQQVCDLTQSLRRAVGRADAPILIDQEGGRVTRLKPPHWRPAPAAGRFARLADARPEEAVAASRINARLVAAELHPLGITVDCLPVLDLIHAGTHSVIGDRSFGGDVRYVTALGRATAEGLIAGGVLPVMKHMPGHGRATVDSHHELPTVDAALDELEASDFQPFRALNGLPIGMTAHVVFTAIDDRPATLSPIVIDRIIRGGIGFRGLLLTDDLGMQALPGGMGARAAAAVAAGCDIALHCSGEFDEMVDVLESVPDLSLAGRVRLDQANALRRAPDDIDFDALAAQVDALLAAA
jgi:beta-N-acetylhexosaminidase